MTSLSLSIGFLQLQTMDSFDPDFLCRLNIPVHNLSDFILSPNIFLPPDD